MALAKIDKNFSPKSKQINYLNKTFPQYRQSLIDFAKAYYPDTYTDFNESSPGMMFIEMAAYVGDVLSYYIDSQFRENLLEYAEEYDNVIALAQAFGYKPHPKTAATAELQVFQLCPALGASGGYGIDTRYLLVINPGMVVRASQFSQSFRTTDVVNFNDISDAEITVYATDGLGKPLTYLIRKTVRAVAGEIKTYSQSFGTAQRFSKLTLADDNVLEIVSIKDSANDTWREVDYLAQDIVFDESQNTSVASPTESTAPYYIIKFAKTPKRFVTRYNADFKLEVLFGSGVLDDQSERINLDSHRIASTEYETNIASTAIDPADFLSSKAYGISPANTTLTINYTIGGGLESNVPSNSLTEISLIDIRGTSAAFVTQAERNTFQQIYSSVVVNNPLPANGGKDGESIQEIKQNARGFFNAQNRVVTVEDYIVRTYAMPPKFGGIAKAFVARDEQINDIVRNDNSLAPNGGDFVINPATPSVINLYVLGYNQTKKLVTLNAITKDNLKKYLETYRMITDEVRILDAFVVNIGVTFDIIVFKNYNINDVLARAISNVNEFFDVSKWDINQPIILNDLYLEIGKVEGVQSVLGLTITNKYRSVDGADYQDYIYDIASATENQIIYPSLDPMMWEVRYPERDVMGNATQ